MFVLLDPLKVYLPKYLPGYIGQKGEMMIIKKGEPFKREYLSDD